MSLGPLIGILVALLYNGYRRQKAARDAAQRRAAESRARREAGLTE